MGNIVTLQKCFCRLEVQLVAHSLSAPLTINENKRHLGMTNFEFPMVQEVDMDKCLPVQSTLLQLTGHIKKIYSSLFRKVRVYYEELFSVHQFSEPYTVSNLSNRLHFIPSHLPMCWFRKLTGGNTT